MSNLDSMIESAIESRLEKQIAERAQGVIDRVIGRLLGGAPAPVAAAAEEPRKPAKRRAAPKTPKTPAKRKAAPAQVAQRSGPMPGSVADKILNALKTEPHTEAELGELLAAIEASDEAKRQAVARLIRTGKVVVATEKHTRVYRLGATQDPPKGE